MGGICNFGLYSHPLSNTLVSFSNLTSKLVSNFSWNNERINILIQFGTFFAKGWIAVCHNYIFPAALLTCHCSYLRSNRYLLISFYFSNLAMWFLFWVLLTVLKKQCLPSERMMKPPKTSTGCLKYLFLFFI